MAADPLFESLQRLQPMLDSFRNSLSHLCDGSHNIQNVSALRKDLEDHFHDLHTHILSRYETLKQEDQEIHISSPQNQRNREIKQEKPGIAGYSPPKIVPVQVQPKLESLCLAADGNGLRKFMLMIKKERARTRIREELPAALSKAPDAGKLVLNAIEGYVFNSRSSNFKEKMEAVSCQRAYILLLECLFPVFGSEEKPFVPIDVKDKARDVAEVWRVKMGLDKDVGSADGLDIQAFLQLLSTFRIAQDYGQDKLCELLLPIAERKESPALALFLGLYSKIPDFLDKLTRSGKWIQCIRYAHAFGMMDKIKPADLLKAHLENVEKKNSKEMDQCALEMVIRIVKEYDLQNVYSIDDLQNKVQRLEQDQAAKRKVENEKKAVDATKEKNKAVAVKAGKQKKAQITKVQRKRLQSSEPADSIVGFFGTEAPEERGLYRPSERPKHVLEEDFNRVAGGKRNSPSGIDLLARYQSSYHDDIRNTMGPFSGRALNNEQKYYDSYPSTSGYSNINPTGVSLYGSSSMNGAFPVSSFNQSQIDHDVRTQQSCMPSVMATAYTVSSNNPVQVHSEGRTLQSYTSALGAVDKYSFASPRHGKSGLTNSLSNFAENTLPFGGGGSYIAQNNLERREPEQQKSSLANSNLSKFGQSASVGRQSAISKYQFNGGLRF